jgi:hypothetical protein
VQTLIVDTLKLWREAERALQERPPVDPNHEAIRRLVIDLRAMYADWSEAAAMSAEMIAAGRARLEEARERLRNLEPAT